MITEAPAPKPKKKKTDWSALRADFPVLDQEVHGQPLIYFDNAATTQNPRAVLDALRHYYERDNANVNRGLHTLHNRAVPDALAHHSERQHANLPRGIHELSNRAPAAFEPPRPRAAQFINARSAE